MERVTGDSDHGARQTFPVGPITLCRTGGRARSAATAQYRERSGVSIDRRLCARNATDHSEKLDGITKEEFKTNRHLIRHGNDVPVLVTAIKAKPDWLVTANVEHFDEDVALRTGLRIVTPHGFLQQIGIQFRS